MATAGDDLVCTTCGATALGGPDLPPGASAEDRLAVARLTWTRGTEHGDVVWTCERCSRAHLRSIEAKLDQAWW
jgi:hypothetical protein